MLRSKPILRFLLVFVIVYGVMHYTYPSLRTNTSTYLLSIGNKYLSSPFQNAHVSFKKGSGGFDVAVVVSNMTKQSNGIVPAFYENINSYGFAYFPFTLLLALVLASPVSFKRKTFSLFFSLIFLHFLLIFRLYVQIIHVCMSHPSLELRTPSSLNTMMLEGMNTSIILFMVIFIWIGLTFRKEDLALFRSVK